MFNTTIIESVDMECNKALESEMLNMWIGLVQMLPNDLIILRCTTATSIVVGDRGGKKTFNQIG